MTAQILAAALFVFCKDGTNVLSIAPREIPAIGVRLSTREPVYGLESADAETQAACGWYRYEPLPALPETQGWINKGWAISNSWAVRTGTVTNWPVARVFDRAKILDMAQGMGTNAYAAFCQWLATSPRVSLKWYSGEDLMFSDAEIWPAVPELAAGFGMTTQQVWQAVEACAKGKAVRK